MEIHNYLKVVNNLENESVAEVPPAKPECAPKDKGRCWLKMDSQERLAKGGKQSTSPYNYGKNIVPDRLCSVDKISVHKLYVVFKRGVQGAIRWGGGCATGWVGNGVDSDG